LSALIAGTFVGSQGDQVPYLMTLPTTSSGQLAIFQHGLTSDKTAVLAVANTYGAAGLTTIAMDLPLHGDRAIAGKQFLDVNDIGAIRANLLQSAADLIQFRRTALSTGLAGHVFSGHPSFTGVSLGGIVGTDFAAVAGDPEMKVLLSTSGAPLVPVVTTSPTLGPMVAQALAQAGIQPNTPQFTQFLAFAQWEVDAGDPINYAAGLRPLSVLSQVAGMDQVILPQFEMRLANLAGATITVFPNSGHALLINPMDPNIVAAQTEAVQFVAGIPEARAPLLAGGSR
jgi:hypothetical protein